MGEVPVFARDECGVVSAEVGVRSAFEYACGFHPGNADIERAFETFALCPKADPEGLFGDDDTDNVRIGKLCDRLGDDFGRELHVGVDDGDEFTRRLGDAKISLRTPFWSLRIYLVGILAGYFLRVVGGGVVDDNEFDVGVTLFPDRVETRVEKLT